MEELLVKINYLIREKIWCSIRTLCDVELEKGQDPVLIFWKAYGIFNEGNINEAIRELTRVQDRREIQFAAAHALIFYHERCRNIDQEAIDTFVLTMDEREEMANDRDLITAATFLWHISQFKKAGQVINKCLEGNSVNLNAQAVRGWIYLSTMKEDLQQRAMQFFEQVLDEDQGGNSKNLEALLGRAKIYEKTKRFDECLATLSEISVLYPNFQPVLIEKGKIHIQNGEWDNAMECVSAVILKDRTNVEALRIYCFYLLAREYDQEMLQEKFDELQNALRTAESRNSDLIFNISRVFARFCGRKPEVLQRTLQLLDMAIVLQPENAAYQTEIGYQRSLKGEYENAYQAYQRAAQYDETFLMPLYGMIYCRIKQEQFEDASQQLEFLLEISESQGKSSEHAFLEAQLEWRFKGNKLDAIRLLDTSLNLHIQQTKTATTNLDFYIKLNADFLMELAQEYLVHCGAKPKISAAGTPKHLVKAIKLLENVTKQNSALSQAQVLLAKARWLSNDTPGALREITDCLQKDASVVEAHLLAAVINSDAGNMRAADNFLKQAFAQDFSIRDNPVFMLMKSEVEIKQKDWEEAKKTLEHIFKLPAVQDPMNQQNNDDQGSNKANFSQQFGMEERSRIFLNLVNVYCELKEFDQAKKILTRAVGEFANTPEEVQVMLAQSDLALKMGDTKRALNMLKKIAPTDRSFVQAKKKQAQIYLDELKDRNNYTRCYLEILDAKSSVENFKLVATALMDIQEPEEAINYYERALQRQSEDTVLVREVGKALVMTHDYSRAIKYYETQILQDPRLLDLRTDLAELYKKLKAFDEARRVLNEALKYLKQMGDGLEVKVRNVKYLMLYAECQLEEDMMLPDWKFKENTVARQALIEARALQSSIIELCRESSSENLDDERLLAAEISFRLGKYDEERIGDANSAIEAYMDCLKKSQEHKEAMVSLARLHQTIGNNEECQSYCQRLLKIDPSNEQATFMFANLMLVNNKTEDAIRTYSQLLEKEPDNFNTLSQLIELLRRAGRIKQVAGFLEKAEANCQRSNLAGLHFCKGLYAWHTGNPIQALKDLNVARFDNIYGQQARINMVSIYLNPAREMIFSSIAETGYSTTQKSVNMAKDLIEELQKTNMDTSILECNVLIATKQRTELQLAAKTLHGILQKNSGYIPALVSMGLCKFLMGTSSEARNYLKQVTKNQYALEFAESFEKALLLMADYFISVNKFDLAETELQKVLKHNASNVKAEELMGLIKEKERAYVDAANHYEKAFEMSSRKNEAVGFRLAFNYLKAERLIDCIDISKEVLKVNPNFPGIQTDLIDKARSLIRK